MDALTLAQLFPAERAPLMRAGGTELLVTLARKFLREHSNNEAGPTIRCLAN
jgi:hypothetical protein